MVAIPSVNQVVLIIEAGESINAGGSSRNPFSESGRSHAKDYLYEGDAATSVGRNPFSESGRSHKNTANTSSWLLMSQSLQ